MGRNRGDAGGSRIFHPFSFDFRANPAKLRSFPGGVALFAGSTGSLTRRKSMNIIDKIEKEQMREEVPEFGPGDTVKVHNRVVEGGKERIQIFEGIVLGRRGTGVNQAFTVRKISNGEGVERVFQLHSPKIAKVEVAARAKVRRAKLNYLRERIGKKATQVRDAD